MAAEGGCLMEPYFADERVTLYLGDMREVLPALGRRFDCCVADPPYGETSLAWDRWPNGWPSLAAGVTDSMWCFGSLRMFLDRRDEFAAWKLSHDVVWEKGAGAGINNDRFRRIHEVVTHWYTGPWSTVYKKPLREPIPATTHIKAGQTIRNKGASVTHGGAQLASDYVSDGTRLVRSVFRTPSMRGRAIHPTEKPTGILAPLIHYACPPDGTVLDPFAGSGAVGEAARMSGRHAVLIERHEPYCEAIARRFDQVALTFD